MTNSEPGATVVAFISQKGGVGKSTLSRGLAREAAKSGLAVKICDLDTQQDTSVEWHRRRLDDVGRHARAGLGRPGAPLSKRAGHTRRHAAFR